MRKVCYKLIPFFYLLRNRSLVLFVSLLGDITVWETGILELTNKPCLFVGDADVDVSLFSPGRVSQDYPMKIVWKKGFIRLVLVVGILWMLLILLALLFHIWSCQTTVSVLSG